MRLMKYKRDPYTKGWLIITAIVIIGLFFLLGINIFTTITDYEGNDNIGGLIQFQFSWLSILWFAIGCIILIRHLLVTTNRSKLRKIVISEFEMNPNISVEEIRVKTGISMKEVSLIILNLKTRGKLRGNFLSDTGEAKSMQVITQEQQFIQETKGYCPYCGTPVSSKEALFCNYCGTKL